MTQAQKVFLATGALVLAGIAAGVVLKLRRPATQPISITGAVLRQASDPHRQMPIPGVQITAVIGKAMGETASDSSGFFRLTLNPENRPILNPEKRRKEVVTIKFRHPNYKPLDVAESPSGQIYIARLTPLFAASTASEPGIPIADVRLRYSTKSIATVNIGSFAKTFEVINTGGVPCNNRPPCSPDGKWKAAIGSASFNAEGDNKFANARASCIAGPCPFTKIQSDELLNDGATIKVVALNWSGTATILVEAEVINTFASEMIRHSYPVIFGDGMNFTLPPSAEGPSIEADLNGKPIVFPLGPDLILSWASCSGKVDADQSKLYRCQLKPGYEFR